MPYRKIVLAQDEIYHVFNRSVAKLPIFLNHYEFSRFIDLCEYYRFLNTPVSFSQLKKMSIPERHQIMINLYAENQIHVDIYAFCVMNNHYHFLLRQTTENGISKFISNLQNGYAKYVNIKTQRTGPLWEPMFKAVRIDSEEQFLHVSRYIHLNPSTGYIVKIEDLENYPWSSLSCYLEGDNSRYPFVNTSLISEILNKKKYREFVFDQAEYQRELGKIRHLILE